MRLANLSAPLKRQLVICPSRASAYHQFNWWF
jgi:hypothetical protein